MPKPKDGWGSRACEKCGASFEKKAPVQRFCFSCSEWRAKRRKIEWQRTHPREAPNQRSARNRNRLVTIKEYGSQVSVRNANGAGLLPNRDGNDLKILLEIPFDGLLSKNAIVNIGTVSGRPFAFVRKDVKKRREAIAWMVVEKMREAGIDRWPEGKVWVDIMVQKPNHRFDAVNVLDTLCDALKVGLGVDDRWFAVGVLDWEIVKVTPKVYVQISRPTILSEEVCTTCGQIKLLDGFSKSKHAGNGVVSVCFDCSSSISRSRGIAHATAGRSLDGRG